MEISIKNTKVLTREGDITEYDGDAVVNAANNQLWMGSGVAGAIKLKGGQEIEKEAMSKAPIPVGEAVITGAGNLKARYVIHAAGMGQDLRTDAKKVYLATLNSLKRAREKSLKSVAFPAIGAGVGGLSIAECASAMLKAVSEHIEQGTTLEEVCFVLYGKKALEQFTKAMGE